ncbi:MAG TPA: hypothetical protein VH081_05575 [Solirubrobacteraceae bacterium]|jgi:hypothetical protein|nr:hypothetical protein [Solirubrobacteraceae bacterium]
MAYDEDLVHHVRELLGDERGITEMTMFGGLAFLLNGHMSVSACPGGGTAPPASVGDNGSAKRLDAFSSTRAARPAAP